MDRKFKLIADDDPDNPGMFSLWSNVPNAINVEIAGKIGERDIAETLAELWNEWQGT